MPRLLHHISVRYPLETPSGPLWSKNAKYEYCHQFSSSKFPCNECRKSLFVQKRDRVIPHRFNKMGFLTIMDIARKPKCHKTYVTILTAVLIFGIF